MIFIVTALASEAAPIIDHFKLPKIAQTPFQIYQNRSVTLIISGIGSISSSIATTYLLSTNQIHKNDICLNLGICGSGFSQEDIGQLYKVTKLIDSTTDKSYILRQHKPPVTLACTPKPQNATNTFHHKLVDMESVGFYLSAKTFITNKQIRIAKVVSDKISDTILEKSEVAALMRNTIPYIESLV